VTRQLPLPPDKPKFVIGSRVRLNERLKAGDPGVGTVVGIRPLSQEELVRTAYAAGFWLYTVAWPNGEAEVSGNLLDLAVIDTLGRLTDAAD